MRYTIVAVSPLNNLFPIVSFGLANIASLDDAKKQITEKYKTMAKMRIDADDARVQIGGGQELNADGRAEIFSDHQKIADAEFEKFEMERWPKIEPALNLHLARQERRVAHFKSACRVSSCDNPKPQPVERHGTNTKSRRSGAKPLFCRNHRWAQGMMSKDDIRRLQADEKNRVKIG